MRPTASRHARWHADRDRHPPGTVDGLVAWLRELGLSHVEISDGTLALERDVKRELISRLSRDFTVLAEVGSKDAQFIMAPYVWVEQIEGDLAAGAWKVIAEARESGTAGIYRADGEVRTGLIDEIAHAIDPARLIFEAPLREQQVWLLKRFGTDATSATSLRTTCCRWRPCGWGCAPTRSSTSPAATAIDGAGVAGAAGAPEGVAVVPGRDERLARTVFALLVVASFAAFFVTQRLKHTPTAVQRFQHSPRFAPHSPDPEHRQERISFKPRPCGRRDRRDHRLLRQRRRDARARPRARTLQTVLAALERASRRRPPLPAGGEPQRAGLAGGAEPRPARAPGRIPRARDAEAPGREVLSPWSFKLVPGERARHARDLAPQRGVLAAAAAGAVAVMVPLALAMRRREELFPLLRRSRCPSACRSRPAARPSTC